MLRSRVLSVLKIVRPKTKILLLLSCFSVFFTLKFVSYFGLLNLKNNYWFWLIVLIHWQLAVKYENNKFIVLELSNCYTLIFKNYNNQLNLTLN